MVILFVVSVNVAYSNSTDRDLCQPHNQLYWDIDCYSIIIHQNDQIIEKLDWSNCVLLNKKTVDYKTPEWFFIQSHEDLIRICGEMP